MKGLMESYLPFICRVVVTSTSGHAEDEPGQPYLPKIMKKKKSFFPIRDVQKDFAPTSLGLR